MALSRLTSIVTALSLSSATAMGLSSAAHQGTAPPSIAEISDRAMAARLAIDAPGAQAPAHATNRARTAELPQLRAVSSQQDIEFVEQALRAGRSEIAAARFARARTQERDVRDLARIFEREQTELNRKLLALHPEPDVADPAPGEVDAVVHALLPVRTDRFDQAYLRMLVDNHLAWVERFELVADDPRYSEQVRTLARQSLPELRRHGTIAEILGDLLDDPERLAVASVMPSQTP